MKTLRPIILRNSYFEDIEKEINGIWYRWIYGRLLKIIDTIGKKELQNSATDALYDALAYGRLDYDAGVISRNTNAAILKILRSIGAKYDGRSETWKVDSLPPKYSMAVAAADSRYQALRQSIIRVLDDASITAAMSEVGIETSFYDTINRTEAQFQETVKSIRIPTVLTYEDKIRLARQWTGNLQLYIKKWSDTNILDLRQKVLSNVVAGQRFENLVKTIEGNYEVSKNKARFLARQETSLAVSSLRQQRYADAGITRYRWSSSEDERVRHSHKELNGKIFDFSNPPISGENGQTGNPGEPFGCRCVAIPVLPGDEFIND
ncbi:phage head morphogenesis protein [Dyadobacter psychrotolerans]|uniref:Phage head morphogenesis domain-containing protein n=1 Tax=Dyadobacter psychrotolerans TaxID=2541721 RepID=A0A4R5E188_9BACT|nr:minor capsid protein [Dyadobacter psychrotolerans]TDE17705.1 hypothetical protein E0F88_07390 [Dyadobacter psychrotolerans]